MHTAPSIRYIQRSAINATAWDASIAAAPNGMPYHYYCYLDTLCPRWDALVLNNYEAVMPLPWRRAWGISYLYQPAFLPQCGIIGPAPVTAAMAGDFLRELGRHFRYGTYTFNEGNPALPQAGGQWRQRTNYLLPLTEDAPTLQASFNRDAAKNIRQARKAGLQLTETLDPSLLVELFRESYGSLNPSVGNRDYEALLRWFRQRSSLPETVCYGIRDPKGDWMGAGAFLKDKRRLTYILGAPSAAGRKHNAIYFLLSEVVNRFAGTGMVFDFEGSDIPSVAQFYAKFGPQAIAYPEWHFNRLPWPLRLLKQ